MAHGHEHYAPEGAGDPGAAAHALHADHGPRVLPADLSAPPIVAAWKKRALIAFAVGLIGSLAVGFLGGFDHVWRGYLMAFMLVFGLAGGGFCGPDGRTSTWRMLEAHAGHLDPSEHELADRLLET